MSFILDALRKSEHERQDRTGPDLAHVRVAHEGEGVPRWVIVLGALLLLNLIVVVGLSLWNRDEPAPPEPALPESTAAVAEKPYLSPSVAPAEPLPKPPPPERAAASSSAESRGEVRSLRGEAAPSQVAKTATTSSAPEQPTRGSVVFEQTELDANPEPERAPPRSPSRASSSGIPSLNEVRLNGLDVPDMAVEIHVYDAVAANRFVFINMNKYSEGDRLKEGPVVEEITPDGAILEHQGQRFLLPRN
ncbi:MAG: general secretion pathway protein GspB [Chromatiales bacterium]|jgi:general secretion pathway protein B|nr:general secretion pathway protein GspB [Chromatiales bacterium]MDH3895335.1 general secretion pathway protein GspB [Chromatiales bacterium]MDH3931579.1 general secretion pathway protein GspB [Chromatiales bacterium]MDH4013334.1 general secretion pathway protein GspB [Chromatiales bacterium]PLX57430.1 MAG: hypothetical protein C0629_02300 [Chromatiales bacterium]